MQIRITGKYKGGPMSKQSLTLTENLAEISKDSKKLRIIPNYVLTCYAYNAITLSIA